MKPSEFKISASVESYGEKVAENIKMTESISLLSYQRYWSYVFIAQIEDMNIDFVTILRSYLLYFPRNKHSKSVTVGSGKYIDLNDSASPKMVIVSMTTWIASSFRNISCQRALWSGRVRSHRLILKWSYNLISIFSDFLKMF